jgi:hypothetical protein
MGRHREALTTLVHDLRDTSSAEAYCALSSNTNNSNDAGEEGDAHREPPCVVSAKLAHAVAESCGLQVWAGALFPLPTGSAPSTTAKRRGHTAVPISSGTSGQRQETLFDTLLDVYMRDPWVTLRFFVFYLIVIAGRCRWSGRRVF